jgi:RNA polymerase sigma factor (sigma-70 family)
VSHDEPFEDDSSNKPEQSSAEPASAIFDAVDLESEFEGETFEQGITKPVYSERIGDLNELYAAWVASPQEENLGRLLQDIGSFALRIFAKNKNQDVLNGVAGEDIAAETVLAVHKYLHTFNNHSTFSTWVRNIVFHVIAKAIRKEQRRAENPLADDAYNRGVRAPEINSRGEVICRGRGTSRNSDTDPEAESHQTLITPSQAFADADKRIFNIDFERAVSRLKARDRRVVRLFREGYEPPEIAEELGITMKQTYNLLARIWRLIRTILEDEETPLARTPRVGLRETTQAGIERAYLDGNRAAQNDIEVARQIALEEHQEFYVYEEDVATRGVEMKNWSGNFAIDQRTYPPSTEGQMVGGRFIKRDIKIPPRASDNPPEKPTIIRPAHRVLCPKCGEGVLLESVYSDGSIHHECHYLAKGQFPCGYLQIWKPRSKLASNELYVMKEDPSVAATTLTKSIPQGAAA